jgi:predicted RNA-binding protein with PIN domain
MHYLIDGYNLLHAMGVLTGRVGPHGLERSRLRLVGLIQGALGEEAKSVTVVFDAGKAPAGVPQEEIRDGLRVQYALKHQEADDLIEEMIRKDSVPHDLVVVSDDQRLRQAARQRKCHELACLDFVEEMQKRRRARKTPRPSDPSETDKPSSPSAAEKELWLNEFAGLEKDEELRELFELDRFGEDSDRPDA